VLSYSIYLIHAPFVLLSLGAIRRAFPGWFDAWSAPTAAVILVLTAGCVALATATYGLIERPFLVRKERFES
jgi:peptidoglycan/LPS O-acetylase OafA/YrhL